MWHKATIKIIILIASVWSCRCLKHDRIMILYCWSCKPAAATAGCEDAASAAFTTPSPGEASVHEQRLCLWDNDLDLIRIGYYLDMVTFDSTNIKFEWEEKGKHLYPFDIHKPYICLARNHGSCNRTTRVLSRVKTSGKLYYFPSSENSRR